MDTCPVCGNLFPRKYQRGQVRQIYCSRACRYAAYAALAVTRVCPTCSRSFQVKLPSKRKTYCSLACIQRHPCQLCGVIITGRARFQSGERRFCSRRCAAIVNASLAAQKNYVVRGFAVTLRRTGRLACERCGFDNPLALVVHHRDRDRRNNREDNLETLCANCHALEHWGQSNVRRRQIEVATLLARLPGTPAAGPRRAAAAARPPSPRAG